MSSLGEENRVLGHQHLTITRKYRINVAFESYSTLEIISEVINIFVLRLLSVREFPDAICQFLEVM